MVPYFPTIQPDNSLAKVTAFKSTLKLLFCLIHVMPPFSVCRIVPMLPTTQQDRGVAKFTNESCLLVPDFCCFHLVPPSSVRAILPPLPTAKPISGATYATPPLSSVPKLGSL